MKIQLLEMPNRYHVKDNLKMVIDKIEKDEQGVDLFVYPECFLTGYNLQGKADQLNCRNWSEESLERVCKNWDVGVFLGAMDEAYHNAYFGFLPKKEVYYKTHLGKKEKSFFKSGENLHVFSYKDWKIGVAICIESHIPDLIQSYRLMGCHLIIMPFASPGVCGDRMKLWLKYLPTRAYDNGVYIAAVNLKDNYFSGGTIVINPKGEILEPENNASVYALDMDLVKEVQSESYKKNYIIRRRPELY